MRILIFVLFLSIGNRAYSQGELDTLSINQKLTRAIQLTNVASDSRPLIILDGGPFKGDIREFKSNDIESIQLVGKNSAKLIYANAGKNGAVIITSKQYKIEAYQNALCFVSKSYHKYILKHGNHSNIQYRLNGTLLSGDEYAVADKLFVINKKDIKRVRVKKHYTKNGDTAIVSIQTGKNNI